MAEASPSTSTDEVKAPEKKLNSRRSNEPAPKAAPASRPPTPEVVHQRNLLGEVDPSRDPFVRQVMDVFGATVVKITVAPAVQIVETETASADGE